MVNNRVKPYERDFNFYVANKDKFNFFGGKPVEVTFSSRGASALMAFKKYDCEGKLVPSHEAELLSEVIVCKKSVNFHIKMWVEGYGDMFTGVDEYLSEFINPPEWVGKAFRSALNR